MHWKLNLSIKVKIDVESSYKIKLDRFDGLEKKKEKEKKEHPSSCCRAWGRYGPWENYIQFQSLPYEKLPEKLINPKQALDKHSPRVIDHPSWTSATLTLQIYSPKCNSRKHRKFYELSSWSFYTPKTLNINTRKASKTLMLKWVAREQRTIVKLELNWMEEVKIIDLGP